MEAANSTIYTLKLSLGSIPSSISWYVTDNTTSTIIVQSKPYESTKVPPRATIQQNISLPDNRTYLFWFYNPMGTGIDCGNTSLCYSLQIQNSLTISPEPLFIGYGNFTCIEQYYIGINAPILQKPLYQGCPAWPIWPIVFIPSINFYMVAGIVLSICLVVLLLIRYRVRRIDRIREEEDERRRMEESAIESEFQEKLNTARKGSILSVLPRTILVDHLLISKVGNSTDVSPQRVTDLERMSCPICLDAFKVEDEICSSPNKACPHIYHTTCMIDWLIHDNQKDHQVCPMCRNDFLELSS